jgi:hypothetical protein
MRNPFRGVGRESTEWLAGEDIAHVVSPALNKPAAFLTLPIIVLAKVWTNLKEPPC